MEMEHGRIGCILSIITCQFMEGFVIYSVFPEKAHPPNIVPVKLSVR